MNTCRMLFVDWAASDANSDAAVSAAKQLKELLSDDEFLDKTVVNFVIEHVQINNQAVIYPDLNLTADVKDDKHPLQSILAPLSQSHQAFGRLSFEKDSDNRTKDCKGYLVFEHDKDNMRVAENYLELNLAQMIGALQIKDPMKMTEDMEKQLEMFVAGRPQPAETFIKQLAFKMEKYAKFGA